jgi:transcriptional regulator with GAF, ATPase, and Fis domain
MSTSQRGPNSDGISDLASELREVAELAARPGRVTPFLGRGLEALAESIDYEFAAFFEAEGGVLRLRCARGPAADATTNDHGVRLDAFPSLRRALDERRVAIVRVREGSPDAELFPGIESLPPEHARLIVPVVAGAHDVGLMTFDRSGTEQYDAETINLARIYGLLLGIGLAAARQAETLDDYRELLEERNRLLIEEVDAESDACEALEACPSRSMRRLVQMAKQVAITDAPVLITGETGTGKEVLARAIHGWSKRADRPFIQINCATLPETLIESELFGHVQGAFSGATGDRRGRFRLADGGTLLLDEVGDLPGSVQVKLLRVLQEGAFEPVGSDKTVHVDVRVLAATNVDLGRAIEEGSFREDLFYRLHVFPLQVPALRERVEDLPALVERILDRIRRRSGRGPWTLDDRALERMTRHDWPGNVRELVNVLERARVGAPLGGPLSIDIKSPKRRSRRGDESRDWPTLREHEARYLRRVLQKTGGKVYGEDGAAALLDLPPTTLQSRLKKLGIAKDSFRPGDGT